MLLSDRRKLMIPSVVLFFAFATAAGWLVSGAVEFLAIGIAFAFCSAFLAIGLGRRLLARLEACEAGLQKSERMRVLGQVSGGLAHQIRSGVAAAKLGVQLHARSCNDGDSESLDVARRQLGRVEADLARFLDLGRDDLPRRTCRIVELVEEAVHLLRPACRHADVQLCWEPPACTPVVNGDPGRLGHLLVNLLTNGVEAAGAGGDIEVTVEQAGPECCVIEIWDSGPGPDGAIADRLFQPFATGKADGVGLGLFVARQAAEAHGGRLDWRRERNRTCFRVELPSGHDAGTREQPVPVDASR
jgi:signal transduction histidine kinase